MCTEERKTKEKSFETQHSEEKGLTNNLYGSNETQSKQVDRVRNELSIRTD
jgi:hypothetical protein